MVRAALAPARPDAQVAVEDHRDPEVRLARRDHQHLQIKRLHKESEGDGLAFLEKLLKIGPQSSSLDGRPPWHHTRSYDDPYVKR